MIDDKDNIANIKNSVFNYYNKKRNIFKTLNLDEQTAKLQTFAKNFASIFLEDEIERYSYMSEEIDQAIFDLVNTSDKLNPDVFEDKHEPWLDDAIDKIDWKYSNRYNEYLFEEKNWDLDTVNGISKSTNIILDHCGNPLNGNNFSVKGLVVGDIQSGKTANYTSLINKCIDVGYKFIIVLAGMTNDLRSQTQKRLDKEVIGYQSLKKLGKGNAIGVGKLKKLDIFSVDCLTDANLDGDLRNLNFTYSLDRENPLLIVIKKNSAKLQALIDFIEGNPAYDKENKKIAVPTLIIDDEADQASLNTKNKEKINEATAINKKIRIILSKLCKYTYIGYTATPFANAFVNPFLDNDIPEEEKDVFPEDFIITLKTPDNYSGVNEFFGNKAYKNVVDDGEAFNLDLYRKITTEEVNAVFGSGKEKAVVDSTAKNLPYSLKEAIMHFLIASAIKISRGIIGHNSMLIHVTHYTDPNVSIKPLVYNELSLLIRKFKYKDGEKMFKKYWEKNIKPISKKRLGPEFGDDWSHIVKSMKRVFELAERDETVVVIGGHSEDIIDYDSSSEGLHIVIGGNKLSRGLTLEGLVVSYYYRNARAYDTLLQMGRWFGYREGWLDLCRIYTTSDILDDFVHSAEALESFKKDIKVMNKLHYTPRNFGLKVATSPKLTPTSRGKMRHSNKVRISFSGDLQQTISFDPSQRSYNRALTLDFLKNREYSKRENGSYVFKNVSADDVLSFLANYKENSNERNRISVSAWRDYIEQLNSKGELINWTIVLHSLKNKKEENDIDNFGPFEIIKPRRKNRKEMTTDWNNKLDNGDFKQLGIKVLTNPADFLNFYEDGDPIVKNHTQYDPESDEIMDTFTPDNGLLTIYVFDITSCEDDKSMRHVYSNGEGLVGLGLWFPLSKHSEISTEYYINDIYSSHGGKEIDEDSEDIYDD